MLSYSEKKALDNQKFDRVEEIAKQQGFVIVPQSKRRTLIVQLLYGVRGTFAAEPGKRSTALHGTIVFRGSHHDALNWIAEHTPALPEEFNTL